MAPVQCARCGVVISSEVGGERLASISGSIFGDECTETCYYCAQCDVYTVEIYWDTFLARICIPEGPTRADGDDRSPSSASVHPPHKDLSLPASRLTRRRA